jgi:hypothetical protein
MFSRLSVKIKSEKEVREVLELLEKHTSVFWATGDLPTVFKYESSVTGLIICNENNKYVLYWDNHKYFKGLSIEEFKRQVNIFIPGKFCKTFGGIKF